LRKIRDRIIDKRLKGFPRNQVVVIVGICQVLAVIEVSGFVGKEGSASKGN
jgi:hypothetical protein